jgi:FMN reductase
VSSRFVSLRDFPLPPFDDAEIYESEAHKELHRLTAEADGLVLCGPVYNWSVSSELKRFVECVGSYSGDRRGALFDKVVTIVNAAGLPHSYMAFSNLAASLMLDFKCIINPYVLYVHNQHWVDDTLAADVSARVAKTMEVMIQLTQVGMSAGGSRGRDDTPRREMRLRRPSTGDEQYRASRKRLDSSDCIVNSSAPREIGESLRTQSMTTLVERIHVMRGR